MAELTNEQARVLNKIANAAIDLRDRYHSVVNRVNSDLLSLNHGYRPAGIPGEVLTELVALQAEIDTAAEVGRVLGVDSDQIRLAISDPDYKAVATKEDRA